MTYVNSDDNRNQYGAVMKSVVHWVESQADDKEFWYGDAAEELGIRLASVSGILRKLVNEQDPKIMRSQRRGWYRKARYPVPGETPPSRQNLAADSGELMLVVGTTLAGKMLRDDSGALWQAQRI